MRRASQEWQRRRQPSNISMFNTAHSAALNSSLRWQPATPQPSLRPGVSAFNPAKTSAQLSPPSLSPTTSILAEKPLPQQPQQQLAPAAAAAADTADGAGHNIEIVSAVPLPHVVRTKSGSASFGIPTRSFSSG